MRVKTKVAIVFLSSVVTLYAIIGGFLSNPGEAAAHGSQYAQTSIFQEVLTHIIHDYVDEPDLEKVRVGSLRGLAEGLDPYSAYLTSEQVKQYNPQSSQAETGIFLSKVSGYAYVVGVLKGSPADQAGIHDGDFIEYVDKVPSRDLSLYDIQQLMSGQAGTSIPLRIVRQGQSHKITVNRVKLAQPAIEARIEETGVGYIKITSLADGKSGDVRNALKDLTARGAQKILLDLRNSSGGKLQEGVAVANLFVGQGTLGRVLGKEGKETQTFAADPAKVVFNGPLTVIIDRSTAGPAEVIAAAVRDQKRGELVGERSFGMGSEQRIFPFDDGGALLMTIAKYAPGAGKAFMDEPITPTVKVERPADTDLLVPDSDDDDDHPDEKTEPATPQPKPEATPAPPVEDVQLKKALEILKQTQSHGQAAAKHATLRNGDVHEAGVVPYERRRAA